MHSRLETQLMTNSKPMLVLAVLIASTLIPTSKLMAQKADQPPMAHETITLLITKGVAGPPRRAGSDVHGGFSAGHFKPHPPPQCADVGLSDGGLRRDAGENREKQSPCGQNLPSGNCWPGIARRKSAIGASIGSRRWTEKISCGE